jgi:hypothetical protein
MATNNFRTLRIFLLLLVLLFVSLSTWLAKIRSTDWDAPLWVVIYPVNGDDSEEVDEYIQNLTKESFKSIESFMQEEAEHFKLDLRNPVTVKLAPEIHELPPQPPRERNVLKIIWWSLKLRYWAYSHNNFEGPKPHIQIYVVYFNPGTKSRVTHSLGLEKGLIGVVSAFASKKMSEQNMVVIAHEMLHTLGASDKYHPKNNQPIYPIGYAQPNLIPPLPQTYAEIMGGRIPITEIRSIIPSGLNKTVIGEYTALEINWIQRK